jgi:NADH-quinone oxidoreductase subunit M
MPAVAALGLYNLAAFVLLRVVLPILPDAARAAGRVAVPLLLAAGLATTIAALVRTEWRRSIAFASLAYALLSLAAAWTRSPDGLTASVLYLVALGLAMPVLAVFGAYPSPAEPRSRRRVSRRRCSCWPC